MKSVDLSKITSRNEADSAIKEKIPSEKIRGFILKNLQRNAGNNFSWKINVPALLNNLDKIMEGVGLNNDFNDRITGFPVIFLKGEESDYLPLSDFGDIQNVFPAAELVVIAKAGHWLHADQPEEVITSFHKLLYDS
jgi:pimeloyl-ACP methyl ester carboxylesterase